MRRLSELGGLGVLLAVVSAPCVFGQEGVPAFRKFCGRVPVLGVEFSLFDPAVPNPIGEEDCTNGEDDNGDGLIDYGDGSAPNNGDPDCLSQLGPQTIRLKTPFDVVQPVAGAMPAHFTGADRNFDMGGEILINSTGPGGRKHSYLRTDDPNRYEDVRVRALILPGTDGDQGGPVAVRIQESGKSYYAKVVPGNSVSIEKDNGDGTSTTLASATQWDSGESLFIEPYDETVPVPYQVILTARGSSLTAAISEVENNLLASLSDSVEPIDAGSGPRTVILTASDDELADGYIGLRSDADQDRGTDAPSNADSGIFDPSVLDYFVSDPNETPDPNAPRILYFSGVGGDIRDNLNYTTDPITPTNYRPYRRSGTTISDQTAVNYLRSVGFVVDDFPISSFSLGFLTPEDVNAGPWDIWFVPGSGGSGDTRGFFRDVTIPTIFSEHVDGSPEWGGVWQEPNNGNERILNCGDPRGFTATIDAAQEEPIPQGVPDEAGGSASFSYDSDTRELTFHIEFSGLSSPETAAHIHTGALGEPGPVLHPLPAGSPKQGSVTLSADEENLLLAGSLYVNIHTEINRAGEIRGQIQAADAECTATSLPNLKDAGCETLTTLRVFPEELFGDPDHPIIRGLADENGDIPVSDASQIPLNVGYPFPPATPGLNGAGFMDIETVLTQRRWGLGASETQMGGWPPTEGGVALAGFVNPCDGSLLRETDPGQGHTSLIAVEEGSPRATPDDPTLEFEARTVFYWVSDQAFHYSTSQALAILRRVALWSIHLLESENRSARPFQRGDANADGRIDIADPVNVFSFLFTAGGDDPPCLDAADADDSEEINITDGVLVLGYLFSSSEPPKPPFNTCFQGCALDFTPPPTPEQLAAEAADPGSILSCAEYDRCR